MKEKIVLFLVAMIGLFYIGFGVKTIVMLPPTAVVMYDNSTNFYATPKCILVGDTATIYIKNRDQINQPTSSLILEDAVDKTFLADARKTGKPDPKCKNADGFIKRQGSISGDLLKRILGR